MPWLYSLFVINELPFAPQNKKKKKEEEEKKKNDVAIVDDQTFLCNLHVN